MYTFMGVDGLVDVADWSFVANTSSVSDHVPSASHAGSTVVRLSMAT